MGRRQEIAEIAIKGSLAAFLEQDSANAETMGNARKIRSAAEAQRDAGEAKEDELKQRIASLTRQLLDLEIKTRSDYRKACRIASDLEKQVEEDLSDDIGVNAVEEPSQVVELSRTKQPRRIAAASAT